MTTTTAFLAKMTHVSEFIQKHWRGEYSLGVAYWRIGVGLTLCLSLLMWAIDKLIPVSATSSQLYGVLLVILYLFTAIFTVWQLVGIWRSAKYHTSNGGRQGWATAAQIMVVVAALRAVFDFNQFGFPLVQEGLGLMTTGENLGGFELRVLNQGTELEYIGHIPFGATATVNDMLQRFPEIRVIHLNSPGGRILEGVQLYDLIQEYQLDTYTPSECSSACTIAFMGGRNRYLNKRGILGFHSASLQQIDGQQVTALNDEFKRIFRQHGVSESFIRQAVRVSGASIWYPGQLELVEARVVTELVASERFAPSNAVDNAAVTWQPEHLLQAPDNELVNYWSATVDVLNYLNYVDPQYCVDYLYPQWAQQPLSAEAVLPANLILAHQQAKIDLVENTQLSKSYHYRPGTAGILFDEVLAELNRIDQRFADAYQRPEQHRASPRLVCSATIAVYEEALRLSTPERQAALLRYLQQRH